MQKAIYNELHTLLHYDSLFGRDRRDSIGRYRTLPTFVGRAFHLWEKDDQKDIADRAENDTDNLPNPSTGQNYMIRFVYRSSGYWLPQN